MANLPFTGIDISEFNGDVNIEALKGKVDFIIIRCGYGGNYENQDDSQYENNVKKCEKYGIPYGVYLYSYAKNAEMAKNEAAHALRLLRGKKPLYGVWYDVEDSTLPAGEALVDNCIAFCDEVEKAGYYCGIYSFLNWMEERLSGPRLDRFDKWVAQWNDELDYEKPFGIWQYSNNGLINGQRFDMDLSYKDYPKIIGEEGDEDMTREEVKALAQQVYDQNEKKYKTIDSVPGWAKGSVRKVYEELELSGVGKGEEVALNGSFTYVRMLHVIAKLMELLQNGSENAPGEEQKQEKDA